jgi:hypothetical protein
MRHPYFKEAREADAKRATQTTTEGAVSTDGASSGTVEAQKPKKQMDLNNSSVNKNNQPLVKTLPSIGAGNSNEGGVTYVPEPPGAHAKVISGSNVTHSTSKHNTVPLFNSANQHTGAGAVAGSSLPPIAGNSGDQSSRSNRSLQQQQQQQSAQKKKKKNTTTKGSTYAQQVPSRP